MKLIYKFSMDDFIKDYIKTQKFYFSSIIWSLSLLVLTVSTAILKWIEISALQSVLVLAGSLLVAIVICFVVKKHWSAGLKKKLMKDWPEDWPINFDTEIELRPDTIRHTDILGEMRIPYANIKGVKEEKGMVIIDLKFSDSISVPVAQIRNIEEKDMFLAELKGKIPIC